MIIDVNEAPAGFVAVLKSSVGISKIGDFCSICDWRKQCNDKETDFENSDNRCMSSSVISNKTGSEIKRNDGCGVVFKKVN